MPHSTTEPTVNGTSPSSKTLSKLSSYPTVASGIETYKTNPYGKRSLELAEDAYNRFGKPAQSYLETPIEYIKPYANRADELGENALGTIEERLPIVKEQPQTIWESGKGVTMWPYNYGVEVWNDEYTKTSKQNNNDKGLFTLISALISFNMRLVSDAFALIADYTKPRYEEAKKSAADYVDAAQDKVADAKAFAQDKLGEAKQNGEAHAQSAQQTGEQVKLGVEKNADSAKEQAKEGKEQVEKGAKKSK